MADSVVAGIDLGFTNACVGVVVRGKADIVINARGERFTPISVTIQDDETLVGHVPSSSPSDGTNIDIMRLLLDNYMTSSKKTNANGDVNVEVELCSGDKKHFTFSELLTMMFGLLKKNADNQIGEEVKRVVLSVPSVLNDDQRKIVTECCTKSGIIVLSLIDRSIASVFGYELQKKIISKQSLCIFRLGSTQLDISIISTHDHEATIISTKAITFDCYIVAVVKHFVSEVVRRHDVDITGNREAMSSMERECRNLIRALTRSETAQIRVSNLAPGLEFTGQLSRARFDQLASTSVSAMQKQLSNVMGKADLKPSDVSEVVLCGGFSRLPIVGTTLKEYFTNAHICSDIDPGEVTALGAAQYATLASLRTLSESRFLTPAHLSMKNDILTRSLAPHKKTKERQLRPSKSKSRNVAEAPPTYAIGIDLGTTNSCVAFVRRENVEILENSSGKRITPSCVAFTENTRYVGQAAFEQFSANPENTVFDVKRLIGRKMIDIKANEKTDLWPFKLIDYRGNPKVEVVHKQITKQLSPEELSSMVLREMKSIAETKIGSPVRDAVITVPAYFNDSQRQATMDAGKIAGLNVLSIINEPTAAALAYGVDKRIEEKRNVLIFDLGGGTFDVALLSIEGDNFEVLSVDGDVCLGGRDFDMRLVEHLIAEFKKKNKIDLSSSFKALTKLRLASEDAKRYLSSALKTRIQIASLYNGIDFVSNISRVRFEVLCADLFQKTLDPVKRVLSNAALTTADVNEVVLVGGSTRMPKIKELIQQMFKNKKLNETINPDEAVAYGAAIHASNISKTLNRKINLIDVCPMTLGIAECGIFMNPLILRNSRIPTKKTSYFSPAKADQDTATVAVYEGDRKLVFDNNILGQFKLHGVGCTQYGKPNIELVCEIDKNGILKVSAKNQSTGTKKSINITSLKGRLEKQDIERCIAEASTFEDDGFQQQLLARAELEKYCLDMIANVQLKRKDLRSFILDTRFTEVEKVLNDTLSWLDDNNEVAVEIIDQKHSDLMVRCKDVDM